MLVKCAVQRLFVQQPNHTEISAKFTDSHRRGAAYTKLNLTVTLRNADRPRKVQRLK